jgi:thiol-disulfide isomerase/thioredoxin
MFSKTALILVLCLLCFTSLSKAQLKAGDKAPRVFITDWISNIPEDKDLRGKFVIIDFWATWCAPCLESMPHMNDLVDKYKSRKDLVFIAMTDEERVKVEGLLKRVPFSSIVVSDTTRTTFRDFKIKSIPTCVVIDPEGGIKWVGHSSKVNSAIIDKILKGENPESINVDAEYTVKEASKITDSLVKRYGPYFMDDQIKEYFDFGPLTAEKPIMNMSIPTKVLVIGMSLKGQLSQYFKVSDNQIVLPEKLSKGLMSYIYKTRENRNERELMKLILQRLNLKYRTVDSLMEVMQLEVVDKALLKKYALMPGGIITSMTNNSKTYSAIFNAPFSELEPAIEGAFNTTVVFKGEGDFKNKMSVTIKHDNLENLKSSLKSYGIEVSSVKKKLPVYVFESISR